MKKLLPVLLIAAASSQADVVIVNNDSAGEGFNATTAVSAVGGNPGTTLGQQRLNVFQKAADILNATYQIDAIVKVGSSFDPLTCSSGSAVLGQAGPTVYEFDYGTQSITPHALYNQQYGSDANTGYVEITAQFNSSIDNNNSCLYGTNWYYGYDEPTGVDKSLLSVVLHEILHGMGFLSLLQSNGVSGGGWNTGMGYVEGFDPYTRKLKDASTGQFLTAQSSSTRAAVMTSTNNLVWGGTEANAEAGNYTLGTNGGAMKMYAPASYEPGSSVSHFDVTLTPNELMEPMYTEFLSTPGLAEQLLVDIGWSYNSTTVSNNAPVLGAVGNKSLSEDGTLSVSLSATDADGDSLSYSLSSATSQLGASISGSTLTITPTANWNGSGNLTVQVSDGTDTDSEAITVTVTAVNDAPVLAAVGNRTLSEDNTSSFTVSATDVDSGSLTYSITSATAALGASISGQTITLTPTANYSGSGTLTVQVSDGSLTDSETITVTVSAVNDAPVLATIGNKSMAEDATLTVALSATDTEGDSLTFSVSSATAALNASVSGSTLTIAPTTNYTGTGSITIVVSDGSASDSETFSVTVSGSNDAPVLGAIGNKSMSEDGTLSVTLSATDADGDSLTYSITSATASLGASVSGTTLSVVPVANYNGSGSVTVQVSDGALTDSETFTVTVSAVNDAPTISGISNRTMDYSASATVTLAGSDVDGDSLTYTATSSDTALVTTSVSGNQLTLNAVGSTETSATITVTVSDGSLSAQTTFTVTLQDPSTPDPLTLTVGGQALNDGDTLSVSLSNVTLTPAGGSGNFTVTAFFDGADHSELLTVSGSSITLGMPDSGAFAGTYRIDVNDGSSTATYWLERPLRLSTSVTPLLAATSASQLIIEGAPAGTTLTLASSSGVLSFRDDLNNGISQTDAVDDAASFNATSVALDAASAATPTVTVSGSNIVDTELDVTVVARRSLLLTVRDSFSRTLAGAEISVSDERFEEWGLETTFVTNANGQATLELPLLDTDVVVSASGYEQASSSLPAAAGGATITLAAAASAYTLNGLISARGFTFNGELPVIAVELSDGSLSVPKVDQKSNTRIEYTWATSLSDAVPETLVVSHSKVPDIRIPLNPAFSEETVDVTLAVAGNSDNTAPGAGHALWLLLSGLLLIRRRSAP